MNATANAANQVWPSPYLGAGELALAQPRYQGYQNFPIILLPLSRGLFDQHQNPPGIDTLPAFPTPSPLHAATAVLVATMASVNEDALILLRQSIASGSDVFPTASDDATAPEVSLSQATHLTFTAPTRISLPIDVPTRFTSNSQPVGLRSIYFAWLKREVAIPEYNDSASGLNEELAKGNKDRVRQFAFVERLDLITWLEGASEESEYIKPLAGDKDGASSSAAAALASKGAAATATGSAAGRSGKGTLDPRLANIYNSERKMGDRNTVLRGTKPTVRNPWPRPCNIY